MMKNALKWSMVVFAGLGLTAAAQVTVTGEKAELDKAGDLVVYLLVEGPGDLGELDLAASSITAFKDDTGKDLGTKAADVPAAEGATRYLAVEKVATGKQRVSIVSPADLGAGAKTLDLAGGLKFLINGGLTETVYELQCAAPVVAAADAPKQEAIVWPTLSLAGTMGGKKNMAIINGKLVAEGEEIEGVKLVKVTGKRVELEYKGETFSMKPGDPSP